MKIFITLLALCVMTAPLMAESFIQTGEKENSKSILQVNLLQLLTAPSKFANKKVRFTAYVVRSNSDTFLFNSRDDVETFRIDSALMGFMSEQIDLKLVVEQMDRKLLIVEGVFKVQDSNSAPSVVGLINISYLRYH